MEDSAAKRGRKPNVYVRKYFKYDEETKKSNCLIEGCDALIKGQNSTNLQRHIFTNHGHESNELSIQLVQRKLQDQLEEGGSSAAKQRRSASGERESSAPSTSKKLSSQKLVIEMNEDTLKDALVDLITTDGRPLSAVEDTGITKILQPIVIAINAKKPSDEQQFVINRQNVGNLVRAEAAKEREKLSAELKNRMFCLKTDMATRLGRSILGVNAQFCHNGRLELRNLGCRETFLSHSASNLRLEVTSILDDYGVGVNQIYTSTTDNAANFIKCVTLLSEDVDLCVETHGSASESESSDQNEEAEEASPVDVNERAETLPKPLYSELPTEIEIKGIISQRCAAHTFQLAVWDTLRDIASLIGKVRHLATKLRTPTAVSHLMRLCRRKPSSDVETRWNSTIDMIDGVLAIKDVIAEVLTPAQRSAVNLSIAEWGELKEISATLLPAKIATKRMQAEQLTVGDFMGIWLECKLQIKKQETISPFARKMTKAIESREEKLFDSQAILCGLYLDPRYQLILSGQAKERAVDHLVALWDRLQSLSPQPQDSSEGSFTSTSFDNSCVEGDATSDCASETGGHLLESFLTSFEARTIRSLPSSSSIRQKLKDFSKVSRLRKDFDVLMYWEGKKKSDPELYNLAQVVLSVPVTQVSVERTFSHLKYILSIVRSSLTSSLVDDILFVRCNRLLKSPPKSPSID